jgi:hypothetical protein
VSLDLIEDSSVGVDARILDVGGGDSLLADRLLARGYRDVTMLDVPDAALSRARQRRAPAVDSLPGSRPTSRHSWRPRISTTGTTVLPFSF